MARLTGWHETAWRAKARAGALVAALVVTGCEGLFGPTSSGSAYALTSIAGRPASVVNTLQWLKQADTLYGSYVYVVTESVTIQPDGRGELCTTIRQRFNDPFPALPADERSYTTRRPFRYQEEGREVRVRMDACFTVCDSTCRVVCSGGDDYRTFIRSRWGTLEQDYGELGSWHYERVR